MIFPWIPWPVLWLPAVPSLNTARLSCGCRLGVIDGNHRGSPGAFVLASEFPAVFEKHLGFRGPRVAGRPGPAGTRAALVKITLGVQNGVARARRAWLQCFHTGASSPGLWEFRVLTLRAGQAGISSTATPRLLACWRSPSGSSGVATAGVVSSPVALARILARRSARCRSSSSGHREALITTCLRFVPRRMMSVAVRSSSSIWLIRPVSTASAIASWKDGCDSPGARTMRALSIPRVRTRLVARWAAPFLVLGGGDVAQAAVNSLDLLNHGRIARVGLADYCGQLQQRLGENVLPYPAPEGWVPFQGINDVLEGGDRRGHLLVTSF